MTWIPALRSSAPIRRRGGDSGVPARRSERSWTAACRGTPGRRRWSQDAGTGKSCLRVGGSTGEPLSRDRRRGRPKGSVYRVVAESGALEPRLPYPDPTVSELPREPSGADASGRPRRHGRGASRWNAANSDPIRWRRRRAGLEQAWGFRLDLAPHRSGRFEPLDGAGGGGRDPMASGEVLGIKRQGIAVGVVAFAVAGRLRRR